MPPVVSQSDERFDFAHPLFACPIGSESKISRPIYICPGLLDSSLKLNYRALRRK